MIAFLAHSEDPLAQWRRKCPTVYITPELRIGMPPESQARIMEKIRLAWSSFPQQTMEGIRIDTPAGWILVCPSLVEPALTFRFESLDWPALDHLVERFCDSCSDLGKELWQNYVAAMGMAESKNSMV